MDLRLARFDYPITVLGPGRRVGVWVQGCTIGCAGCMSRHTWSTTDGSVMSVDDLAASIIAARDRAQLDGVTISGGEPFQQPDGLLQLLGALRAQWPGGDVLVYSGYSFDHLFRKHRPLLDLADAVMTGPYVASLGTATPWRGSSNQVLHVLTSDLRPRYEDAERASGHRLQIAVVDSALHVTGVPQRGDLERMTERLADRGLLLKGSSWHS